MELKAYTKSIKDILTLNNKYIIPRFQREYSWEKNELQEFIDDICENIDINEEGEYAVTDYFIGSLVLVGNEKEPDFYVVDGQQRLTTITILFSVLTQLFEDSNEEDLANSCYLFIEGKDNDNHPYFKLQNENPSPFIKHRIQYKEKDATYEPHTNEEKRLLSAYNYYYDFLKEKKITKFLSNNNYLCILKAIREQLKNFTVVYITVDTMDNANVIFETLNAKGKNLDSVDLIKNEIFKVLCSDHPTDSTKTKWKQICTTLTEREKTDKMIVFLRHFWLSKYTYTSKAKLYSAFKDNIKSDKESYTIFLNELLEAASIYSIILYPLSEDYSRNEQKCILKYLNALNLFNVSQPRTLLIVLLLKYKNDSKVLGLTRLKDYLKLLVNFHFQFSAISSSRASSLERIYSNFAKKVRVAKTKTLISKIFDELRSRLLLELPKCDSFKTNFEKLIFTKSKQNSKSLIKYILQEFETYHSGTSEKVIEDFSIEHINDQSNNLECMGKIGNLIPLSQKLNSDMNTKLFSEKCSFYKKSQFETVKLFLKENGSKNEFVEYDIDDRTRKMADCAYNEIWKI